MAGAWTPVLDQEVSFRIEFLHGGIIRLRKNQKTEFLKSKEATSDLLHFYMQEK